MEYKNIKNIIFDLGGVIEKISPSSVVNAFKEIGVKNYDSFFTLYRQSDVCSKFETGKLSSDEFVNYIKTCIATNVSDKDIIHAWNANQLGIDHETLDTITELKKRGFNLFILSNTNPIHYAFVEKNFSNEFGQKIDEIFDDIYLSYQIGHRKPTKEIYQSLKLNAIDFESSVFIDDLEDNLLIPKMSGMHTILHDTNSKIDYLLDLIS